MMCLRLPFLFAALLLAGSPAQAQGFFERLFGIVPDRPAAPPPGYRPAPPPSEALPMDEPRRTAPPPQARPVVLRVPTEDAVIGRELKQNGSAGSMRVERTGGSDLRARITLAGRRSSQSVETCSVTLGGSEGAVLVQQGRPDGVARYELREASSTCPLQVDFLDEAVLVKAKGDSCLIQTSTCQADAAGMWGPEAAQLTPKAREYEAARGSADKAVRDNYKVLVQRSRPEAVRPLVAEQASFSSEREMVCRTYAREGSHSFCNARFSEARAISLAQRLGMTVASAQAQSQAPNPAESRARRRVDPYSLPDTDELVQRSPLDD
ncbi:hypothetical protein [uncultured Enterovirga sp.]|uniref:hypothetical protein n=1 Tax=uncultured Enterovirga sp. TaxID=2026352 RepID=UPI0035CAA0E6